MHTAYAAEEKEINKSLFFLYFICMQFSELLQVLMRNSFWNL